MRERASGDCREAMGALCIPPFRRATRSAHQAVSVFLRVARSESATARRFLVLLSKKKGGGRGSDGRTSTLRRRHEPVARRLGRADAE